MSPRNNTEASTLDHLLEDNIAEEASCYEIIEEALRQAKDGNPTVEQLTALTDLLALRLDHLLPESEEWEEEEWLRQQLGNLPVLCIEALQTADSSAAEEINRLLIVAADLFVKIGLKDSLESVDEGIEYHWVTATDLAEVLAPARAAAPETGLTAAQVKEWEVAAQYVGSHYDENNQLRS